MPKVLQLGELLRLAAEINPGYAKRLGNQIEDACGRLADIILAEYRVLRGGVIQDGRGMSVSFHPADTNQPPPFRLAQFDPEGEWG